MSCVPRQGLFFDVRRVLALVETKSRGRSTPAAGGLCFSGSRSPGVRSGTEISWVCLSRSRPSASVERYQAAGGPYASAAAGLQVFVLAPNCLGCAYLGLCLSLSGDRYRIASPNRLLSVDADLASAVGRHSGLFVVGSALQ